MRSFDMTAELNMTVQVPDEFLKNMREAAQAEDASEFLKVCQERYPDDDDEFLLMILRNGFKRHIREGVQELCQYSGLGGTFSPVKLRDRTPPADVEPVLASKVSEVIPE